MVELGSLTYQDIVNCALENDKLYRRKLGTDRLIEKHRPELKFQIINWTSIWIKREYN